MPIEINDWDAGLGNIIHGQGIVSEQELIDVLRKHLTQDKEKFKKYRYSLCDLTAVTKLDVTIKTVEAVANLCIQAANVNPDPVVAFVGERDHVFGLMRMHEINISGTDWETMVFRSKKEAVGWIKEQVKEKFGIVDLSFS